MCQTEATFCTFFFLIFSLFVFFLYEFFAFPFNWGPLSTLTCFKIALAILPKQQVYNRPSIQWEIIIIQPIRYGKQLLQIFIGMSFLVKWASIFPIDREFIIFVQTEEHIFLPFFTLRQVYFRPRLIWNILNLSKLHGRCPLISVQRALHMFFRCFDARRKCLHQGACSSFSGLKTSLYALWGQ